MNEDILVINERRLLKKKDFDRRLRILHAPCSTTCTLKRSPDLKQKNILWSSKFLYSFNLKNSEILQKKLFTTESFIILIYP